jgi:hypothetical protein
MVRPVKASQPLLKNVRALSGPETQIITGAVSAVEELAFGLTRSDPERAIEGGIRGFDPQPGIEH